MDHHADHIFFEPHDLRGLGVENRLDDLDLEEVVSRPQRSALLGAPLDGPGTDELGVGLGQAPVGFRVLDVACCRQVTAPQIADAVGHELPQFLRRKTVLPAAADSGWNALEQRVHQRPELRLDLLIDRCKSV